ncbi:hypothetical protein SLEP1_g6145 [Rubroshorea leprosula]|uniref:FCP1 homology domain-containing protein n=1 Tax=Rubroshorea leprosula TaxID=152421 RepID=A0AAV5I342_9ROSI|nr:hypothetical protein SLEP1_g6145 [Rubroshorea leprosula]
MIVINSPILIQNPEMVSKIIKRTPPKSVKRQKRRSHSHHHHRRKSSTLSKKTASVSLLSSINKSFLTCRRRLVKLFDKLSRLATPKRSHRGFRILTQEEIEFDPEPRPELVLELEPSLVVPRALLFDDVDQFRLPPLVSEKQRTIFLDLDETLVHSSQDPPQKMYDFVVKPVIEGQIMNFYVLKRPGVDKFLEEISKKYEVVVFTAGLKQYASLVLDALDPKGLISHRLYRDSCRCVEGRYVKDLSEMGRDMRRVVIVDDNPNSYSLQPENAIPIIPFLDDVNDRELEKLVGFFQRCDRFDDMRDAVKQYLGGGSNGGVDGGVYSLAEREQ